MSNDLTINPNYFMTHFELGVVYLLKSMFKESVVEYEKAADLSDGNPFVIGMSCYVLLSYWGK